MSDGGYLIPSWVADEYGRALGFPDGRTAFDAITALESLTPQHVKDALALGAKAPTFAEGVVLCLQHLDAHYVGDLDIERTLGWIANLIEENAP